MQHVDVITPLLDEWKQSFTADWTHIERIRGERDALMAELIEWKRTHAHAEVMAYSFWKGVIYFVTLGCSLETRACAASYVTRTFCNRRLADGKRDDMRAYAHALLLNIAGRHAEAPRSFPTKLNPVYFHDIACVMHAMEKLNAGHPATRMAIAYEKKLSCFAKNLVAHGIAFLLFHVGAVLVVVLLGVFVRWFLK